jgi:hypothetical protein
MQEAGVTFKDIDVVALGTFFSHQRVQETLQLP